MAEQLLTIKQLSAELSVPVATLYQWNYRGTGPRRVRCGNHVRYRRSDVDSWLNRRVTGGEEVRSA